ncbi:MAG: 3-deoxy-8-phosphooctulonate synthase [Saprospiraceae bacterium]
MNFNFSTLQTSHPSFFLIAGPCAIENEESSMLIAENINSICCDLGIPFIFKASYRKANRTSYNSFTGIGDSKAISIIKKIKDKFDLPVTTDIHEAHEAQIVSDIVDIIQIPAFLCRQTELIIAAAKTNKIVNIKKGQFMSGASMAFAAEKVRSTGNNKVILTERGNSFGYENLVVDMRNIPIMQGHACPVVLDCTHANQRPNQTSGVTDGTASHIALLAKAGIAAGADGLFIETHPHPNKALSDARNMLSLDALRPLLEQLLKIKKSLSDA